MTATIAALTPAAPPPSSTTFIIVLAAFAAAWISLDVLIATGAIWEGADMALSEEQLRNVAIRILKEMADGVPDQPMTFEELPEGRISALTLKKQRNVTDRNEPGQFGVWLTLDAALSRAEAEAAWCRRAVAAIRRAKLR